MQTSDLRLRQNLDPAAHVGPRDRLFIAHCSTAVHERGLRTHFFHARRYWKIERKAAFATTPALFRRGCTTQAKLHTMVGRCLNNCNRSCRNNCLQELLADFRLQVHCFKNWRRNPVRRASAQHSLEDWSPDLLAQSYHCGSQLV